MTYNVYILYSKELNLHYVGFSQFSAKRHRQHLSGQSKWTSRTNDWQVAWSAEINTREQARALEKQIKKRGARRFLEDLPR